MSTVTLDPECGPKGSSGNVSAGGTILMQVLYHETNRAMRLLRYSVVTVAGQRHVDFPTDLAYT